MATAMVLAGLVSASPAAAQTTVVLDAPDSEVVDTTIRAGSYASKNQNGDSLITRASDNAEYIRRALLKFDTHNTIPAGATIQSATLTLTLEHSDPQTRTVSVYRVASSWDEGTATWNSRKSGLYWGTKGGDLAAKYTSTSVGTSAGSKVSFNITKLVQEVVKGQYGSRYTRVALTDDGASSGDSYKEYYRSETSDASLRPRLTVVWGGSSTSTSTSTSTSSGSTSTSGTLTVLQWNVHHGGIGTDGRYDPARIASWIAKMNPHVASLNEVDNTSQVDAIVSKLNSLTGRTWTTKFSGQGNLMISRLPVDTKTNCTYNSSYPRVSPHLRLTVNGRAISVWATHLDAYNGSTRLAETKAMQSCAGAFAEARILAGDYNMQAGSTEYNASVTYYKDAWTWAKSGGVAVNYSGNCDGCTRNSRIDYVFSSKGATFLTMKSARMVDTRDANGKMPSDHKPLLVTYTVK